MLHCRGPKDDAAAVLATLLLSADLAPWELSEIEQRNLLTVFVQQRCLQGRRVVLVLDDAHTFKPAAWEEFERLLAFKLDTRRDRAAARGTALAREPTRSGALALDAERALRARVRRAVAGRAGELRRMASRHASRWAIS